MVYDSNDAHFPFFPFLVARSLRFVRCSTASSWSIFQRKDQMQIQKQHECTHYDFIIVSKNSAIHFGFRLSLWKIRPVNKINFLSRNSPVIIANIKCRCMCSLNVTYARTHRIHSHPNHSFREKKSTVNYNRILSYSQPDRQIFNLQSHSKSNKTISYALCLQFGLMATAAAVFPLNH